MSEWFKPQRKGALNMAIVKRTGGCLLAAVVSFSLLPAFANAQLRNQAAEVKSGQATPIATFSTFNTTSCYAGPLAKTAIKQPKHGKLTTSVRNITISRGQCKGKKAKSLVVIYQSDRGYRGPDSASVNFTFPKYPGASSMTSRYSVFRINVK
jgi:hypothetical protein